jgi:hypothetical protein
MEKPLYYNWDGCKIIVSEEEFAAKKKLHNILEFLRYPRADFGWDDQGTVIPMHCFERIADLIAYKAVASVADRQIIPLFHEFAHWCYTNDLAELTHWYLWDTYHENDILKEIRLLLGKLADLPLA